MWLLIAFLAVPLIEIALFISVGGWIGLWPTLLIVVVTAVAGTVMVRSQGALALDRLRRSLSELSDPSEPLAHGAMILFSGALLLTPGFFTDACGFALLIPAVRAVAFRFLKSRIKVAEFRMGSADRPGGSPSGMRRGDRVIEADYEEVADPRPTHSPERGPSGWTRH